MRENGRVRIYKNCHKSNKKAGKNHQSQLFQNLDINQSLAKWGESLFKKRLNLSKNWDLWHFNLSYFHPPSLAHGSLENQQIAIMLKLPSWQPSEVAEWSWTSLKASFPENCHLLTCLVVPWKTALTRLSLFDKTQSRAHLLRGVCQNNQFQLFNFVAALGEG